MEIYERIKQRRKELGLSAEDVAAALGVSPATIYRYEKKDIKKFPTEILDPLAKVLHTSPAYLLGWVDDSEQTASNIIPLTKVRRIPLIGKIACGAPILATQNVEEMLLLPDNVKADFALTCKGDSMIDARIHDGDIVFVLSQEEVENGEIAAVRIGDEATLKRFYRKGDTVILQPENKNYEPLVFSKDEINSSDIEIIGKATYFLSKIKH